MLPLASAHTQLDPDSSLTTGDFHLPGQERGKPSVSVQLNLTRPSIHALQREVVVNQLAFLKKYSHTIHSIVVVGSTAYNAQSESSDIDIVIITTPSSHEKICNIIFEKEIDEALDERNSSKLEFTILSSSQTEKLFQISSPFAYSVRHGTIIQDDGYLLLLRNKRFPSLPSKEYYTSSLCEYIAAPYYGTLKKLQGILRQKHCSMKCCSTNKHCDGLQPADRFAKLIMRMFYVTLPSRGMIPLTKDDVVNYAKKAYGSQGEKVARNVISLLRNKGSVLYFDEFRVLKRFAVLMFREILKIIGPDTEARTIIHDAAKLMRGDHQEISNYALKNCVV